jgi:hypothetical protein
MSMPTKEGHVSGVAIEGIALAHPFERHQNSLWRALRTDNGRLVCVIMERQCAVARWVELGQRIRVVGPMVMKGWQDGTHPTLSAHDRVEILTFTAAETNIASGYFSTAEKWPGAIFQRGSHEAESGAR